MPLLALHLGWLFPAVSGTLNLHLLYLQSPLCFPQRKKIIALKVYAWLWNSGNYLMFFQLEGSCATHFYAITCMFVVVVCWEGCLYWNFCSFASDLTKCLIPNCRVYLFSLCILCYKGHTCVSVFKSLFCTLWSKTLIRCFWSQWFILLIML